MFSEFCSISALSCSFEFLVGGWVGGGWWYSQWLLCLNPTTVKVVLLLGCDNISFFCFMICFKLNFVTAFLPYQKFLPTARNVRLMLQFLSQVRATHLASGFWLVQFLSVILSFCGSHFCLNSQIFINFWLPVSDWSKFY